MHLKSAAPGRKGTDEEIFFSAGYQCPVIFHMQKRLYLHRSLPSNVFCFSYKVDCQILSIKLNYVIMCFPGGHSGRKCGEKKLGLILSIKHICHLIVKGKKVAPAKMTAL